MAYNAVEQQDHPEDDSISSHSPIQSPPNHLFLGSHSGYTSHNHNQNQISSPTSGLSQMIQSITSKSTKTSSSYDILEEEDYNESAQVSPAISPDRDLSTSRGSPQESLVLNIPRPRPRRNPATVSSNNTESPLSPRALFSKERAPILRTASGHSIALRHPTPDLQTLQGAYTGNIQHLEKTAEQLSMTSSIEDAIRELHMEQKRSDSRRSSLLSQLNEMPQVSRQVSHASSIVEVNNTARSGGFSPAGYIMSPKGSFSTSNTRGRSASKSSRYGSRPEPELEGRPLDSFVNSSFPSPIDPRKSSIAEQDETSSTLTRPVVDNFGTHNMDEQTPNPAEQDRPSTPASTNTYDQAEKMFADFDGIHSAPRRISEEHGSTIEEQMRIPSGITSLMAGSIPDLDQKRVSSGAELSIAGAELNNHQRRTPSGNQQSLPRPQSYADPTTGQQMVYYPAPVPMMLNLPQKLSKLPSSMERNKRRSQALSSIPAAARGSAIWLPDVLESDHRSIVPEDDEAQHMEYIPQHQRMSMGGRRNTQDLDHLPPQLKANAFFELPAHSEVVELKEQSAVATLDSILDASAHAPVSAFTDHAFAGHLGSEVYGKSGIRNSKSSTQLLQPDSGKKKRTSSINLLLGRRSSSQNQLEPEPDKRRSTMSNFLERKTTRSPIEDDDDDENNKESTPLRQSRAVSGEFNLPGDEAEEDEEDEGQLDDEIYHGPPTTLLAELQLRKQQQKQRTRPITSMYPNGLHSTLLQLDTVAQVQQASRKQKQVNLAWQGTHDMDRSAEDDEDIPLAMLNVTKQAQELDRPIGLMERRELEDNEPLSRRRERLTGRQPINRASTMMNVSSPPEEEGETLAQRVKRLKEQGGTATGLPAARPVSGDFASEMMSQFGGDLGKEDVKGKSREVTATPALEEEETLGQRRKRLQAEREARAKEVGTAGEPAQERPALNTRRSMADILQAHPAAGASRTTSFGYNKQSRPATGLLGLHEKQSMQRASTMTNLINQQSSGQQQRSSRIKSGIYNDGQGGIRPPQQANYNFQNSMASFPQFAQPNMNYNYNFNQPMPYTNPYAMGFTNNAMQMGGYMPNMQHANPMVGMHMEPLNQGQLDMVERWRQSVMH